MYVECSNCNNEMYIQSDKIEKIKNTIIECTDCGKKIELREYEDVDKSPEEDGYMNFIKSRIMDMFSSNESDTDSSLPEEYRDYKRLFEKRDWSDPLVDEIFPPRKLEQQIEKMQMKSEKREDIDEIEEKDIDEIEEADTDPDIEEKHPNFEEKDDRLDFDKEFEVETFEPEDVDDKYEFVAGLTIVEETYYEDKRVEDIFEDREIDVEIAKTLFNNYLKIDDIEEAYNNNDFNHSFEEVLCLTEEFNTLFNSMWKNAIELTIYTYFKQEGEYTLVDTYFKHFNNRLFAIRRDTKLCHSIYSKFNQEEKEDLEKVHNKFTEDVDEQDIYVPIVVYLDE